MSSESKKALREALAKTLAISMVHHAQEMIKEIQWGNVDELRISQKELQTSVEEIVQRLIEIEFSE